MISIDRRDHIENAQVRGATYAFLATALQYPNDDMLAQLFDPARWSAWKQGVNNHMPELSPLVESFEKQAGDGNGLEVQELHQSFVDLFGHAVRGTCPAYEIEYGKAEIIQQAGELADIRGFYEAFGMEMVEGAHERIDHACAECEFMSALCAKQAYAIQEGNQEAEEILRQGQASFLRHHLGRWLAAFGNRLHDANPCGFYGKVGNLAAECMRIECSRFGVPCGHQFMPLRSVDPANDASISCGAEESCPGGTAEPGQHTVQIGINR